MDKLKTAWLVLRKHHFWVLFGLVLLVSLLTWMSATNDLANRFNQRKTKLEGLRTNLVSIAGEVNHPNEEFIKGITNRHAGLKEVVFQAWKKLYNQQKESNPLPKVLSDGFQEEFARRAGPLESFPGGEMDPKYRDEYLYHIERHLPTLSKMIERREEDTDDGGSGKGKRPAAGRRPDVAANPLLGGARDKKEAVKMKGIVDWDDADKSRIESRFSRWKTTPSTFEVLVAQEDLWVYEAVLRVIRNTNNVGTDKYVSPADRKKAAVKRIMALEIGQEAAQGWQGVGRSGAGGAIAGPGGAMPGPAAGPAASREAPGRGAGSEAASPLAGRYVDDKGQPLPDPNQQPYAEFRMMPITLRIIIEQKAIPKLLAECANSSMPIDVRSLRVLLGEGATIDMAAAAAGATEGPGAVAGPGVRPVAPPPTAMNRGVARGEMAGAGARKESKAMDVEESDWANRYEPPVPLEIQGIIYIYNPPDGSKVGTGTAGGGASAATPAESSGTEPKPAAPATPAAPTTPTVPATPATPLTPAPAAPVVPGTPATPTVPAAPATPAASGLTVPPTTPGPAGPPAPVAPAATAPAATAPAAGPAVPAPAAKGGQP